MDDYEDDDWGDDRPRRPWKIVGAVVAVALIGAVAFWQLAAKDETQRGAQAGNSTLSIASTSIVEGDFASSTDLPDTSTIGNSVQSTSATDSTDSSVVRPDVSNTTINVGSSASSTSTSTSSTSSTDIATERGSVDTTTSVAVVSLPPVPDTSLSAYPTNPDGSPLPIVVIFDTTTITISGQVPSQAAKDRLAVLAVANSQFPDVELVDNMVINSAVPISVGVRVIELNSARFPEGTAQIKPDHAAELDRVVSIMNALPNISVLIVGHADQRGDDFKNFAISDERARAVVNYLVYLGISPTRLASRAAGASDLLTTVNDEAAFALNRRTEFIFYGLLIE